MPDVMKTVLPLDSQSGAAMDLTLTSTQSLTRNILGSIGVDGAVAHPLIISEAMMPRKTKESPPTLNLFMLHPFLFVALEAAFNIG
jgi:hypothetical protein